jgi:hypothetical protein
MKEEFVNKPRSSRQGGEKSGNLSPFNLLASLDKLMHVDKLFKNGVPVEHMPKIGFLFALCLVYIWLNHKANKTIVNLAKAKATLEDMRVQYITQKSEYMYKSKQSEVAKMVLPSGLIEPKEPPSKLENLK